MKYDLILDKTGDHYFGYAAEILRVDKGDGTRPGAELLTREYAKKHSALVELREMVTREGWEVDWERLDDRAIVKDRA